MKLDFTCMFCGCTRMSFVNTYKYHWFCCHDCGNMFSRRKDSYFFSRYLPRPIGKLLPASLQDMLYRNEDVISRNAIGYDYYSEVVKEHKSARGTNWSKEKETFLGILGKAGISVDGQSFLDISGGPGFLVKDLKEVTRRAVVTEYSEVSVQGIEENLEVEAVKYDFNRDELDQVTDGPFNLVRLNSIGFCDDISKLAVSLHKVVSPGGHVLAMFGPPTLGRLLMWQHDDYYLKILLHPDTVTRIFMEAGFTPVYRETINTDKHYLFNKKANFLHRLAIFPFAMYYGLLAGLGKKSINREPYLKTNIQIFQA